MNRHFKAQRTLLNSVKGVRPVAILTLTAALTELGSLGSTTAAGKPKNVAIVACMRKLSTIVNVASNPAPVVRARSSSGSIPTSKFYR